MSSISGNEIFFIEKISPLLSPKMLSKIQNLLCNLDSLSISDSIDVFDGIQNDHSMEELDRNLLQWLQIQLYIFIETEPTESLNRYVWKAIEKTLIELIEEGSSNASQPIQTISDTIIENLFDKIIISKLSSKKDQDLVRVARILTNLESFLNRLFQFASQSIETIDLCQKRMTIYLCRIYLDFNANYIDAIDTNFTLQQYAFMNSMYKIIMFVSQKFTNHSRYDSLETIKYEEIKSLALFIEAIEQLLESKGEVIAFQTRLLACKVIFSLSSIEKFPNHSTYEQLQCRMISKRFGPKSSITLLSAYLIVSPFEMIDSNRIELRQWISYALDSLKFSKESEDCFYKSFLMLQWLPLVDRFIRLDPNRIDLDDRLDLGRIIDFAIKYCHHNNVAHLSTLLKKSFQMLQTLSTEIEWQTLLQADFHHQLSRKTLLHLILIVQESLNPLLLEKIFGDKIKKNLTLGKIFKIFLDHSNSDPDYVDDDFDYDDDDRAVDDDDADQRLISISDFFSQKDLDNSLRSIEFLSPSNRSSLRSNDCVTLIRFRLSLCPESIISELSELFQRSKSKDIALFFKTILVKLLEITDSPLRMVLSQILSPSKDAKIPQLKPNLILELFRINQRLSLNLLDDEMSFFEEFFNKNLNDFEKILNDPEDICLQTIALMVESKKISSRFPRKSLRILKNLIRITETIRKPYGRDQLSSLFDKISDRILQNINSLQENLEEDQQKMIDYQQFLLEQINYCLENLSEEQYFGQLLIYLRVIHSFLIKFLLLKPIKTKSNLMLIKFLTNTQNYFRFTEANLRCIFTMLMHSFEEIRSIALQILILIYRNRLIELSSDDFDRLKNHSRRMLKKFQPNHAITGVMILKFLISIQDQEYDHTVTQDSLLGDLDERIQKVGENLMNVVDAPIYPILMALRVVFFEKDSCKSFQHEKIASDRLQQIILSCCEACHSVSEIVCNDSPEGHLPMDWTRMPRASEDYIRFDSDQSVKNCPHLTAQILLFNGWMTIKESVRLISLIIERFLDQNHRFIASETIADVLNFFYHFQINLVHRGAFEQTSNCFESIATKLWRNNCDCCRNKIGSIIDDICLKLTNFEAETKDREFVSITRRSGGLPLMIKSILAGESDSDEKFFKIIQCLLNLLDENHLQQRFSWQIIHSLNILRALVNDSKFDSRIQIHLEPLLKVVVTWFDRIKYHHSFIRSKSSIFSVRNSSSTLLNALMTKIFGVKRNRSDTSLKNRLSLSAFFDRFPSFFETIENVLADPKANESLYPIVIVLSKIIISISDNNVDLIERIVTLLRSKIFQIKEFLLRKITIRSFVLLLSASNYYDEFKLLHRNLITIKTIPSDDFIHCNGLLLSEIVWQLLNTTIRSTSLLEEEIDNSTSLLKSVVTEEILDIIYAIYKHLDTILLESDLQLRYNFLTKSILHRAHYRTYVLIALSEPKLLSTLNPQKFCTVFENIISNLKNDLTNLGLDQYLATLVLDLLIHLDLNQFDPKLLELFVSIRNPSFFEAKLAFWSWVMAIAPISGHRDRKDCFVCRGKFSRISLNIDSVHQELINESILIGKIIFKRNHTSIPIDIVWNCFENLSDHSSEIQSLLKPSLSIRQLTNCQLEISAKIFTFLVKRKLKFCEITSNQLESRTFRIESLAQLIQNSFDEIDFESSLIRSLTYFITQHECSEEIITKILPTIKTMVEHRDNQSNQIFAIACFSSIVKNSLLSNRNCSALSDEFKENLIVELSSTTLKQFSNGNRLIRREFRTRFLPFYSNLNETWRRFDESLSPQQVTILSLFLTITKISSNPLEIILKIITNLLDEFSKIYHSFNQNDPNQHRLFTSFEISEIDLTVINDSVKLFKRWLSIHSNHHNRQDEIFRELRDKIHALIKNNEFEDGKPSVDILEDLIENRAQFKFNKILHSILRQLDFESFR